MSICLHMDWAHDTAARLFVCRACGTRVTEEAVQACVPYDSAPAPWEAIAMAGPTDGNGRWVWIPDDDRPDPPHDDSKDHTPCPDCNAHGKGKTPGWYHPLTGPAEHCKWCEGAGWL